MMSSGGKSELADQDVVGALADFGLARERIGLAVLVERHHHHGGAMAARDLCLVDELLLAFLHRDRIDDRLALHAFQAGFDHCEFRGVDHHRHARDIRLGGDQVEERTIAASESSIASSMLMSMICAPFSTCWRATCKRRGIIARGDQLAEFGRARDVGALADIDEGNRGRQFERLEAGEPQPRLDHGNRARLLRRDRRRDRRDMVRRGAAAAADDVDETGFGEFADQPAMYSGLSSYWPNSLGRPAFG